MREPTLTIAISAGATPSAAKTAANTVKDSIQLANSIHLYGMRLSNPGNLPPSR